VKGFVLIEKGQSHTGTDGQKMGWAKTALSSSIHHEFTKQEEHFPMFGRA